jgi:hypothetical protein
MNKHERAKRLIEKEVRIHRDVMVQAPSHPQHPDWEQSADALTYALKVLEAVEGVCLHHIDALNTGITELFYSGRAVEARGLDNLREIVFNILDAKADNV